MRQTPDIGSLDDFFDDDEDGQPRLRARARGPQKSAAPGTDNEGAPKGDSPPVSRRNAEDTVSLDGMTIDELLALSDSPPPDPDDPDAVRDDTGEWDAIEDMLDPDVMLRESEEKK